LGHNGELWGFEHQADKKDPAITFFSYINTGAQPTDESRLPVHSSRNIFFSKQQLAQKFQCHLYISLPFSNHNSAI